MRHGVVFSILLVWVLFLGMAPAALASTTWYVDGVNGNDGNSCMSAQTACKTIGHVISLASKRDSIMVAPATYTENLTFNFSLKVIGSGASTTILDGGFVSRVVTIPYGSARVTLSKVTIQNGYSDVEGGGINNSGALTINESIISGNDSPYGGGINNPDGLLTINDSSISGNRAGLGGGILNGGTLTINKSTISWNRARWGGGITNDGWLTINDSTISGNSVQIGTEGVQQSVGGGILNEYPGWLTINNSTISGNNASGGIGAIGGGIDGDASLQNSIVANNLQGNCDGSMASLGYNVSSDNTCNFNFPGDLNDTDPLLGPLQNNGGPTQTQALLKGSPAIDAGNPKGCTDGQGNLLKTDQRGRPRPDPHDHHGCDMGAYENQKY